MTDNPPSYHDLHVTTANIPRTYGEYDEWLILDVAGHIIADSRI